MLAVLLRRPLPVWQDGDAGFPNLHGLPMTRYSDPYATGEETCSCGARTRITTSRFSLNTELQKWRDGHRHATPAPAAPRSLEIECLPNGTVVQVGHPENGHTATKVAGQWRSNYDRRVLDLDPRDITTVLSRGRA